MALYNVVVMVADRVNAESEFDDAKCLKSGHVVDFLPVGMELGKMVLDASHDFWRVLQVDIPKSELEALKQSEFGDPKINLMLQSRAFKLDFSKLMAHEKAQFIDSNPKSPIPILSARLTELKVTVPVRINSAVLG